MINVKVRKISWGKNFLFLLCCVIKLLKDRVFWLNFLKIVEICYWFWIGILILYLRIRIFKIIVGIIVRYKLMFKINL